jgi:hypothetical protein
MSQIPKPVAPSLPSAQEQLITSPETPAWAGDATTIDDIPTSGLSPNFLPKPVELERLEGAPIQEALSQKGARLGVMLGALRFSSRHIQPQAIPERMKIRNLVTFGDMANETARQYVQTMFPEKRLSLLSDDGSSAQVFEDGEGRIYKVMKTPDDYSYTEDEVGGIEQLYQLGLGPKLHGLVDAAYKYRSVNPTRRTSFTDIPFHRIDGDGVLPVIVTDKVNKGEIMEEMSDDDIIAGMEELVAIVVENDLSLGDIEFVYDRDKGKIQIIDAGGLGRMTPDRQFYDGTTTNSNPDLSYQEFKKHEAILNVLLSFGGFVGPDISNMISKAPFGEVLRTQLASTRDRQRKT